MSLSPGEELLAATSSSVAALIDKAPVVGAFKPFGENAMELLVASATTAKIDSDIFIFSVLCFHDGCSPSF
jgi:hypothetical protein